jgi:methyl-accepting chemotaxis protein
MKKIDLILNIDPGNTGYANLKKITSAFEALAVVLDTLEIILKELSANLGDFGKKFNENQRNIEKFAEAQKNFETGGTRVGEVIKSLSDRVENLAQKLEKMT